MIPMQQAGASLAQMQGGLQIQPPLNMGATGMQLPIGMLPGVPPGAQFSLPTAEVGGAENVELGAAAAGLQNASVALRAANLQQANAAQNLKAHTSALQQQIQRQQQMATLQLSQAMQSPEQVRGGEFPPVFPASTGGTTNLSDMPAQDSSGTARLPSKHQERQVV